MAVKTKIIFYFLWFTCVFVLADSTKITSLGELEEQLDFTKLKAPVLIVFDLHGTLAVAADYHGIGSDPWIRDLLNFNIPFLDVCDAWAEIHSDVPLTLLDPRAGPIIERLQKKADVMVLTGGLVTLQERYVSQVEELGLDFSWNSIPQRLRFSVKSKTGSFEFQVRFRNGILAVGPNVSKGDGLNAFLQAAKYQPNTVVVIDDQPKYFAEFEKIQGPDLLSFHMDVPHPTYDYAKALAGLGRFADRFHSITVCKQIAERLAR